MNRTKMNHIKRNKPRTLRQDACHTLLLRQSRIGLPDGTLLPVSTPKPVVRGVGDTGRHD